MIKNMPTDALPPAGVVVDFAKQKSYVVTIADAKIGVWLDRSNFYVYAAHYKPLESKNGINNKGGLTVPFLGNVELAWKVAVEATMPQ